MDRPEDVEPNPRTGKVYVMLTNNSERRAGQVDAVHSRAPEHWGLVLELGTPDGDHAATIGTWDILVTGGDPNDPRVRGKWNPATSEHGWFANPDNCAIDPQGRLWISTDQGSGWKDNSGSADGLWALETEGEGRGTGRMFFRVPVGAELCGPCFTPDAETLFVAVQHPASDGVKRYEPFGRRSTFRDPATRWPDFEDDMPPRPSVVAITKRGGGTIGG
jgi:secreted PhoX family phosphatase